MKEKKFSQLLLERRQELEYSQDEMATALRLGLRMYQLYENGNYDSTYSKRREPIIRRLEKLRPLQEKVSVTGHLFITGSLTREISDLKSRVKALEEVIDRMRGLWSNGTEKHGTEHGTKRSRKGVKQAEKSVNN